MQNAIFFMIVFHCYMVLKVNTLFMQKSAFSHDRRSGFAIRCFCKIRICNPTFIYFRIANIANPERQIRSNLTIVLYCISFSTFNFDYVQTPHVRHNLNKFSFCTHLIDVFNFQLYKIFLIGIMNFSKSDMFSMMISAVPCMFDK